MTLVETVFKKTKEDRARLPFSQVSVECRVSMDEVEHLLMKALSLGLVKGSIDEINQIALVCCF